MAVKHFLFALLLTVLLVPSAWAQDAALEKRVQLAHEMHKVKPMAVQIESAVRQLALRYPEDKQELFISKMLQVFDQKTLTDISVNAMAETFSEAELQKMLDYYGSPEGKAIEEKMPIYQTIVEPEIIKRIDQALMEIRTGGAGGQP
ncbi:MAG: DUF2059 domain-containing protein [Rhodospirillales bacterium]|nr:DUF2059 domain-containing protein [Rhodospirillales bacterium]MCB9996079.1 DUF2059 domain-containing protein [Rhodospirillales bacterium]